MLLVLCTCQLFGQVTSSQARQYVADKNYSKAIEAYTTIYGLHPDSVYSEYLYVLVTTKKYAEAEQLVRKQMTLRYNPVLNLDLGSIFFLKGDYEKSKAAFDEVLNRINGDFNYTDQVARAFMDFGLEDYAIRAYERTGAMVGQYFFSTPLAKVYAKCGQYDKAIDVLLVPIPNQGLNLENVKAVLLEIAGNDDQKLQQMQKGLLKRINEHPNNDVYYVMLLTWVYTQKNDWEGALIQMEAIDERNKENGNHIFDLARTAAAAKQYETAIKAYDDILAKGKESPYYALARSERLTVGLARIKNNPAYTPADVAELLKQYDSFMVDFPKYYAMQTGSDMALLLAQYGNNVPQAIEVLKKGIADPDLKRNMMGQLKLQLADYYVLIGRIWDASLTYSQVDKEFKQDAMGEDARFRNAKLAYYRGDFDWAQHQLTILKSATSDLISNDAIYLSVLITENVEDSNIVPLQRFAYSGLLMFQNKDKEAEALLDSIAKAFPEHSLNDDILMAKANLARKRREFDKALAYLNTIHEKFGQDVLGDDAVFKMADIYQNDLHKTDLAKHFYEQLIIEYQGSTFVQTARQRLAEINSGSLP